MDVLGQIDGESRAELLRVVGFALLFVLCVRLRPWRWFSVWSRRG